MKLGPPVADTAHRGRADGLNDGLALSFSSAIGSVAGLLGWIVATRLAAPAVTVLVTDRFGDETGALHELGVREAVGRALAYTRLQLISAVAVVVVATLVPVGAPDVAALLPVAYGYIAVQVVCAAAVLLSPARRRPTDVEVVSP